MDEFEQHYYEMGSNLHVWMNQRIEELHLKMYKPQLFLLTPWDYRSLEVFYQYFFHDNIKTIEESHGIKVYKIDYLDESRVY
jgi:hypothetical protein